MDANYNDRIKIDVKVVNTGILPQNLLVYAVVGNFLNAASRKYVGIPIAGGEETLHFDSDEEKSLTIVGRILPVTGNSLYVGQLNYALYQGEAGAIRTVLASILPTLTVVWHQDTASGVWQAFNPAAPDWANDLTSVVPGEKYWIRVSADTTTLLFTPINTEVYPPGLYDIICGVVIPSTGRLLNFNVSMGEVNLLAPVSPG